jgi:hypothetical protein
MPAPACVWVKKPYGDGGWLVDFYAGVDTSIGPDNYPPTLDSSTLLGRLKINGRMLEHLPTAYSDAFNITSISSTMNAISISPIQADQGAGPEGIMALANGAGEGAKYIIDIYATSDIATLRIAYPTQLGSLMVYDAYFKVLQAIDLFGAAFGFVATNLVDLRSATIGVHFTDGIF